MDLLKTEKSKGFQSKIPVRVTGSKGFQSKIPLRAIKPPTGSVENKKAAETVKESFKEATAADKSSHASKDSFKTDKKNLSRRLTMQSKNINSILDCNSSRQKCTNAFNKNSSRNEKLKGVQKNVSTSAKCTNVNSKLSNVNSKNPQKAPAVVKENVANRRLQKNEITQQNKHVAQDKFKPLKQRNARAKVKEDIQNREHDSISESTKEKSKSLSTQNHSKADCTSNRDKGNQYNFPQPDVEFVADEKYRRQILSGKELICKTFGKDKKSSMFERLSMYKVSHTPFDLEKGLEKLRGLGRTDFVSKVTPAPILTPSKLDTCKEVLKSIENVYSSPQVDFEFVADEKSRNEILSGKELNWKAFGINKKSPMFGRPSLYTMSQTPFNLEKGLEKLRKIGRKETGFQGKDVQPACKSTPPLFNRPSLYKRMQPSFDLGKGLEKLRGLEKIESIPQVREVQSVSTPQLAIDDHCKGAPTLVENMSPIQQEKKESILRRRHDQLVTPTLRGSICRQKQHSDGLGLVLKKIEDLQIKNKLKSSKKVTFNLESSDSSPNKCAFNINGGNKDNLAASNERATDGDENKKEKQQPSPLKSNEQTSSPKSHPPSNSTMCAPERNTSPSHYKAMMLRICGHPDFNAGHTPAARAGHTYLPCLSPAFPDKLVSTPKAPTEESFPNAALPIERSHIAVHSAISQSVGPTHHRMSHIDASRRLTLTESRRLSRFCTPQPVSFYPKAGDSISPEFLGRRTSTIVAHAPISTPMVLRNLAPESFEEVPSPGRISPVCQRLNFDEIEEAVDDDTAPESSDCSNEFKKKSWQCSLTWKNILEFNDEECAALLADAKLNVISERHLLNPVAQILRYGDDMHFVPLKLS